MRNVGYDLVNLVAKIEIQLTHTDGCVKSFKIDQKHLSASLIPSSLNTLLQNFIHEKSLESRCLMCSTIGKFIFIVSEYKWRAIELSDLFTPIFPFIRVLA